MISFQNPPRPLLGDQSGQGLELACRARLLPWPGLQAPLAPTGSHGAPPASLPSSVWVVFCFDVTAACPPAPPSFVFLPPGPACYYQEKTGPHLNCRGKWETHVSRHCRGLGFRRALSPPLPTAMGARAQGQGEAQSVTHLRNSGMSWGRQDSHECPWLGRRPEEGVLEGMGLSSLYEGTAPMIRGRGQTGRLKSFRAWGFPLHRCVQILAKQLIISQR